ncbi:MAG TPA: HAD-IA family hydrolase [Phenylobacterium sp.]
MPRQIDALVFDLGGVIVGHDLDYWYERLASKCGAEGARRRLAAALHDIRYSTGQQTIPELHAQLVGDLAYSGDWDEFLLDWSCHLQVDDEMLALVERLAGSCKVLLFSNTNQAHWEHLVAASGGALARYEAHLSHELGDAKPSLSSFRLVAEKAGIEPSRSLFVDDRAENVEAARQVGFAAELFTDRPAFERALAQTYQLL